MKDLDLDLEADSVTNIEIDSSPAMGQPATQFLWSLAVENLFKGRSNPASMFPEYFATRLKNQPLTK